MAVGSTRSTGTGINVPEIVTGLMEVERQPVTKLQSQVDQKTLVISTLGVFKSKVSSLESAAKAIQSKGVYSVKSTTSSDPTKVSATASNAATVGAYTVKVAQTAQAETSMVGGFASAAQVVNLAGFSLTAKQGTASPVTYSPTYAKVGSTAFSLGDKIVFTLNGGSEQAFTVSSQTTPSAVASAINAAVKAGTLSDVTASVDASGFLQLSSSNPLQGLTAKLQIPGYASFSRLATFAAGDVIRFTVSGTAEQSFVVTTQDTAAKVAAGINDAVSAGNLSGVSASVVNGALRITAKTTSAAVVATQNGSGSGINTTSADASNVINYTAGTTTAKTDAGVGGKVLLTPVTLTAGDVIKYTIEDDIERTFTITTETTVTQIADAIAAASSATITATVVNGKLELTSTATAKNISGNYGDKVTSITPNSSGLSTTATVSDVAAWINSLNADLEAAVVQRADGKFALNVSSKKTGSDNAFSLSGLATADAQKDKITLSGTFSVDDAIVLTINGEPLIYKVKANDLTADGLGGDAVSGNSATAYKNIAAAIAAAYAVSASTSSNHSPITASADGAVVTLTANSAGVAFSATSQVLKKAASTWTSTANAPSVAQVDKVRLSGTYAVGDVVSLTVNGIAVSHTVTSNNLTVNGDGNSGTVGGSSDDAYKNIAQALASAYAASTNVAHTSITASASGAVITLTANTAGAKFTTVSSVTALGPVAIRAASVANSIAPATAQADTIALSGKFSAGDVLKVIVGGVALNYTVTAADVIGGGSSSADLERIAQSFVAAYNASTNSAHTPVTASYSGGVITLAADTAGKAFTATSSVTAAVTATGAANRAALIANVSDRGLTSLGAASVNVASSAAAAIATLTPNAAAIPAVAQTTAVTLSGAVPDTGATVSVSVNGETAQYVVQADDLSLGSIATQLKGVIAGSSSLAVTATVAAADASITLTAKTAGTAFSTAVEATSISITTATVTAPAATVPAVAQQDRVTLTGTYTVGETIKLTVNDEIAEYTVQADDLSLSSIASQLKGVIAGSSSLAVTATVAAAAITLTAKTPGTAFNSSVAVTSASAIANGTYTATYDGASWLVAAPSGTYTASLASGTLTVSGGANSITVAGVAGTPKAGDRVTLVVSGGGSSIATSLSEHNAIELQSSRNAFFSINGTAVQRTSNQIEDVISGVKFNLNAPVVPAGGAISSLANADFTAAASTVINVNSGAEDLSAAAFEDFVNAYNDLLTFYKTESVASQDPKTRGVLNSDSTLRTFMDRLRGLYAKGIRLADGSNLSFSSIGVELLRDGSIFLDKGDLNTAVANGLQNKLAAGVTIGYESGTVNLTSFITSALAKTGMLSSHITNEEEEQDRLESRISDWEDKLTRIQDRYYRQYAALDALLFRLQTTSNALTSAIESLVNSQKSN